MLVCYSDISLTPNGHSTQRLKLRILIKARLQTAPPKKRFLRIKSILDRISTHDNPQPLWICLCCTSLRTGNRPNNCTSSEIRDGHTLFKTGEKGRRRVRSTFLANERVLEPLSYAEQGIRAIFLQRQEEGEWYPAFLTPQAHTLE